MTNYGIRMIEKDSLGWDALEEYLFDEGEMYMEEKEMENQTIIWTQPNCPLCEKIKGYLGEGNYQERKAEELISGEDRNEEAMVQLAMQDMQLPLVMTGGDWVDINGLLRKIDSEAA